MVHADVETRVIAHHIFSLLLVPSSLIFKSEHPHATQSQPETCSILSSFSSAFSSAAALFEKSGREKYGFAESSTCVDSIDDSFDGIEMTKLGTTSNADVDSTHSSNPSLCQRCQLSDEQHWEMAQLSSPSSGLKYLVSSTIFP